MKRHLQTKKAVSGKGKGKSSSSSSGGAEAPPPPSSSSSLNNTRTAGTRTVVLPSQTFCATPATVHTYPTKNKTIGAVVAVAATSKTPSSTSSTSAQRIATLRAALAKRERDVFHMVRSWISNRAHYNAVLASLGTRFAVVVDGADEVHPEGANEIIAPATPPPLNFASLRPEFTSVAAAALHHALKRLSEIPLASSSSSSSLNEMHQEVAAAVELVEAALPFCTRLPFRWRQQQQQQQLSDGEGGHQQGNDENLIPHARCYSMYDLQCRLHAIQRLAAARSAWELGRQLQGASVRCIEEFYIFCRRWRLQQQQYGSPREHCEAAGLEIEVVNQSSNNTNNKQLLSITTMDTALYLSLKPPSCSSDSSNTLRRMSSAPRDDVNFVATQSLLQCMVGLINQHCQVSEGSWCRSSTLRKSDSSMVIPPFGVSGGAWIEVADELSRILRVTMQRRELLGLPLFLRSLRRHVTTATMSPCTPAPQIAATTTPLYGSVVGSFFPSVAHLRDHEGFDLSRQVSGDYTIVDKEIREGVCDGSALQFVVVCGEADVMGKYLCEYCGCCGKDEDTKGTAVSRLWRTALSSSAVTSGSSSLRWVNNGNEITLVVAPGCTMLRPDVSHVAMVFGVIVPQHVGQHIKAEENRDPDVAAAADQQRGQYYMNTDSYLCAVIELKR